MSAIVEDPLVVWEKPLKPYDGETGVRFGVTRTAIIEEQPEFSMELELSMKSPLVHLALQSQPDPPSAV